MKAESIIEKISGQRNEALNALAFVHVELDEARAEIAVLKAQIPLHPPPEEKAGD